MQILASAHWYFCGWLAAAVQTKFPAFEDFFILIIRNSRFFMIFIHTDPEKSLFSPEQITFVWEIPVCLNK